MFSDSEKLFNPFYDNESFLLICHENPDPDAIGSASALGLFLKKLGKNVIYYAQKPFRTNLRYIDELRFFSDTNPNPDDYDVLVYLDCSASGYAYVPENLEEKPSIVIDHHLTNTGFGTWNFVKTVSATGELVYELIKLFESKLGKQFLDSEIAISLFTSISGDTGSFQFSNVTKETHEIVCDLYNFVSDFSPYSHILHRETTFDKLKLRTKAIESLELVNSGKIAFVTLDYETIQKFTENEPISDSISNIGTDLRGCIVAATFKEFAPSTYKVSLRSNSSDADVSKFAVKKGGGGHARAAGFSSDEPLSNLKDEICRFFKYI